MKYIIFLLILPVILLSQRDTVTYDLRTYQNITLDSQFIKSDTFFLVTVEYTNDYKTIVIQLDTINEDSLRKYVDSLIVLNEADSINLLNLTETYFDSYKKTNTQYQNRKSLLTKLWAIRPED